MRAVGVQSPAAAHPVLITSCNLNPSQSMIERDPESPSPFFAGDLESYKKQAFVLKEGVEYRIKISFRVRIQIWKVNSTELGSI